MQPEYDYPPYPFFDGHVQNRMHRADGRCLCASCGRSYYRHPPCMDYLFDGCPFLHQLCDGSLVKL